jgi:phosphate transport system substrate-binding protein
MQDLKSQWMNHFGSCCIRYLSIIGLIFAPLSFATQTDAHELKVGGTGASLGLMRILGDAFSKQHPDALLKVMPSMGSGGGIKAVQAGVLNFSISSRPLEAGEAQALNTVVLGITPFILCTHLKNPESTISTRQLFDFYSGNTLQWRNGEPLRLVLRPAKEVDNELLASLSPDMPAAVSSALARKGMIMAFTDQDTADAIEMLSGSLGASTLSLLLAEKRAMKVLAYNGVIPSLKTLGNGSYPFHKQLLLITQKQPDEITRRFVNFIRSAQGRKIISDNGVLPATH